MTLKEILNNIEKVLDNSKRECEDELVSTLNKHIEVKKLIENAAPYFNEPKQSSTPSAKGY